jgi:hypothetical protein
MCNRHGLISRLLNIGKATKTLNSNRGNSSVWRLIGLLHAATLKLAGIVALKHLSGECESNLFWHTLILIAPQKKFSVQCHS